MNRRLGVSLRAAFGSSLRHSHRTNLSLSPYHALHALGSETLPENAPILLVMMEPGCVASDSKVRIFDASFPGSCELQYMQAAAVKGKITSRNYLPWRAPWLACRSCWTSTMLC